MKKFICAPFFLSLFCLGCSAQDTNKKEEVQCPYISVMEPASIVKPGEIHTFTVTISGGTVDRDKIKIVWSVDKGEIISGQGTTSVQIKSSDDNETIIATVDVDSGGDCKVSVSETGIICSCAPMPRLVDEFGKTTSGDMKARIDAYFIELQNNPSDQGYIINYGSKRDVAEREKFIRGYTNLRMFESNRLVFVNGGKEKKIRTRFWIAPQGADASIID